MHIYLHVHQDKYLVSSQKAKQTFFSGYWMHKATNMAVSVLWHGYKCFKSPGFGWGSLATQKVCIRDVLSVQTQPSSSSNINKRTDEIQYDPK